MKNSASSKSLESELSFPLIALESIRPSSINPPINLKLIHNTGLHCVLHIARDSPRPDLIVSVLTITNTNTTNTINNFHFEATVPKVNLFIFFVVKIYLLISKNIRIKLQNPSGSDLPVYNPILPPQAITQIILVSNPNKVNNLFILR
jgi:ADP-ribosylation factor-binding protein GGA